MQRIIPRELSLLAFNTRVLAQARDTRIPLGERCRFLSITESNTDELLMVRIASLLTATHRGKRGASGSAEVLLKSVRRQLREFIAAQQETAADLLSLLSERGVRLLHIRDLDAATLSDMEPLGRQVLADVPALTLDGLRRLPHLRGRLLALAQRLPGSDRLRARIYVLPARVPRFVPVPGRQTQFVAIEELLAYLLEQDTPGSAFLAFRLLRDEDLDYDEYAPDWMEEMERSLRRRGWGRPVGLSYARNFPDFHYDPRLLELIRTGLELPRLAVNGCDACLDLRAFSKLGKSLPARDFYPPFTPKQTVAQGSLMDAIRSRDLLVHVPYESYDPVLELLQEAADDPEVTEICQTLYRVSEHSPVVSALTRAAKAGKKVTVLVELKARFDEAHNIHWAHVLSSAGCRVIYGLQGLKVHGKALLVTRGGEKPEYFLHLGTGNYNEDTARAYSDMHLFTCVPDLCGEARKLFSALSREIKWPEFTTLAVSPHGLRPFLYQKIEEQIEAAGNGRPCGIRAKMNSLSDPDLIDKLYEASRAGVPIELVVRGVCGLRPGIPNLSENIRVVSIVGRYLEHHRIYEFRSGGAWDVYLSSADWMPRNLNRRVEIAFPVRDPQSIERLHRLMDIAISDNTQAWELQSDDSWIRVAHTSGPVIDFQEYCARETQD